MSVLQFTPNHRTFHIFRIPSPLTIPPIATVQAPLATSGIPRRFHVLHSISCENLSHDHCNSEKQRNGSHFWSAPVLPGLIGCFNLCGGAVNSRKIMTRHDLTYRKSGITMFFHHDSIAARYGMTTR
ncbi:hypothetical protein BDZ91DRAFT_547293 [Kalaharituber pfeilii]|nr:hypothetical protein BDZ91DRAFT_547293 [Kalaharituber pfeilii]